MPRELGIRDAQVAISVRFGRTLRSTWEASCFRRTGLSREVGAGSERGSQQAQQVSEESKRRSDHLRKSYRRGAECVFAEYNHDYGLDSVAV